MLQSPRWEAESRQEQEARAQHLRQELEEKEARAQHLSQELEEMEARAQHLRQELEEKEGRVQQMHQELEAKETVAQNLSQELEKREAQLLEERSLHAKALEVACRDSKICLGNPHLDVLKDTVRPDWICMRVVPLDSP